MYLDNHIITLNSTDATLLNGTYLSNVFFNFKGLLKDDINIVRSYITVLNAQIPVSFYVIDSTNNVIRIRNETSLLIGTFVIPIGNYNANTLITTINATIQAVSSFNDIVCSFNPTTGVLTFISTNVYTYFSYANGSTIGEVLGMSSSNRTGQNIALSFPLNLLGKTKLFVNSINLANVAYSSYGNGFSSTLGTIPVNVPPYSLIQYTCAVDQQKNILTNRVLDGIDIQIKDQNNNFVNFNNIPWTMTLVLSIERMDANKFHVQNFNNYLGNSQPIQPQEIELNPPEQDKDLEFLQSV